MYYLPKFYPAVHKKLLGKRLNKVHTPYIIGHILPQFYFLVLFNALEVLTTKIAKRRHVPRKKVLYKNICNCLIKSAKF